MLGALGGQVREREKGSLIVYADTFTKTDTDDAGDAIEVEVPFMKGYMLFNVEQIDGLPGHIYATLPSVNQDIARPEGAERFLKSWHHGVMQSNWSILPVNPHT